MVSVPYRVCLKFIFQEVGNDNWRTIKNSAKARGYTQDSLAEALGMSRGVITNIEYGRAEPQTLVIKAICDILHISQTWLMTGNGNMDIDFDLEKSARLLSYIYNAAKDLTVEEQDYILDLIYTFQKHRDSIKK